MYFKDRAEAGLKLAGELSAYRDKDSAVLALSEGGILVGEQIAKATNSTLSLLLTEAIELADLGGATIGVVDQAGTFTYNDMIPAGVLEETETEMHNVIEEQKMQKFYKLSKLLGQKGLVDKELLRNNSVIIVSDGLKSGMSLNAAANFLKPIKLARLVGATPIASVKAVDKLHILCDEIHVLDVISNYLDTNHYYEDNQIADTDMIMQSINKTYKEQA